MTTDQTDHRTMADDRTRTERALEAAVEQLHSVVLELRVGKVPDTLAAIHDGQQEQTDLLRDMAHSPLTLRHDNEHPMRRDVERGDCHRCTAPEPASESVTVTLPRSTFQATPDDLRVYAASLFSEGHYHPAAKRILTALADALEFASATQEDA